MLTRKFRQVEDGLTYKHKPHMNRMTSTYINTTQTATQWNAPPLDRLLHRLDIDAPLPPPHFLLLTLRLLLLNLLQSPTVVLRAAVEGHRLFYGRGEVGGTTVVTLLLCVWIVQKGTDW